MAKKAAKKGSKVLGKKDLKRTKGGLIGLMPGAAIKINGGGITGNLIGTSKTFTGNSGLGDGSITGNL